MSRLLLTFLLSYFPLLFILESLSIAANKMSSTVFIPGHDSNYLLDTLRLVLVGIVHWHVEDLNRFGQRLVSTQIPF
ncbi:hypothetical protein B0H66DRAFT_568864 [Apodospora peruviana]|uniref:Secreted protein n=1 Tax=Apodospora peruviana TaxID=516989 RepID=A0AAE0LYY7_9PEZI|nr:hypothetical protein B0H66DRAFT_568864 [Apodospora peruviana]